jgi:hypothetical protein
VGIILQARVVGKQLSISSFYARDHYSAH